MAQGSGREAQQKEGGVTAPKQTDARSIFNAALNYEEAVCLLGESAYGTSEKNLRLIGPMCALAAFAVELYLKCLLSDLGCIKPSTHNLKLLFDSLPRQTKSQVGKRYRNYPQQKQLVEHVVSFGKSPEFCSLPVILKSSANAFYEWRYYFEDSATKISINSFQILLAVLRAFIAERHPEWEQGKEMFFRATFPVQ